MFQRSSRGSPYKYLYSRCISYWELKKSNDCFITIPITPTSTVRRWEGAKKIRTNGKWMNHIKSCSLLILISLGEKVNTDPWRRRQQSLWNIGKLLPDCAVQQPRRQQFSNSPSWKPESHRSKRAHFSWSCIPSNVEILGNKQFTVISNNKCIVIYKKVHFPVPLNSQQKYE
jgi:hypothetical protein